MKDYRMRYVSSLLYLIGIPLIIVFGYTILENRMYNLISMLVVVILLLPFFFSFEKKESTSRELVLLSVMVSLAVLSRMAFFFLPGMNPMAAIAIISGIYLGKDFGFMIGALSPLISNMLFTQGPWTPFQMFAYGFVGFLAGLPFIAKYAKEKQWLLWLLGILLGCLFSGMMDVWTVLSADGVFTIKRYLMIILQSFPMTVNYIIANILFLSVLNRPMGDRIERIKQKYGIEVG
ncbi:ECF transporter S component [Vagococcus sp. PNs007]|uniref:ECF transporter S component n=1 Tax=Vagococcus proximus TaxID=2991417 RepID=A0ABT5WZC8_9ENTE|nr:ECF transporter S component [Vagococcus proximus]MDF0479118.1 ECF transporter S component [Vagococcus proximus]